jgi:TonB family protein
MKRVGACLAFFFFSAPTLAFEWDDGRGVLPYKSRGTWRWVSAFQDDPPGRPPWGVYRDWLMAAIRAKTPPRLSFGPGHAMVAFHIGPTGRVNKATVVSASSALHGAAALKIMSTVRTPPPPKGSFDGTQRFKFR